MFFLTQYVYIYIFNYISSVKIHESGWLFGYLALCARVLYLGSRGVEVENILREAPQLAENFLDGLIWRSHKTLEGRLAGWSWTDVT